MRIRFSPPLTDPVPDINLTNDMIRHLESDIDNVNQDLQGDIAGAALGLIGVFVSCPTTLTLASAAAAIGCAGSAAGADLAVDSFAAHHAERAGYHEDYRELINHRDEMLANAAKGLEEIRSLSTEVITPLHHEQVAAYENLRIAEGELAVAERALSDFKQQHGID